jgi:hypothetical protein
MRERVSRRAKAARQQAPRGRVEQAIQELSNADLHRLEAFAVWRMRGLGRRADGRTHEDLLGEALCAALEGRRVWIECNTDFVGFLVGAMRSISDNWGRRYKPEREAWGTPEEAEAVFVGARTVAFIAREPVQESRLIAQQWSEAVARLFDADPVARRIVRRLLDGEDLRDVREDAGLEWNEYRAAVRRVRRRIAKFCETAGLL